MLKYLDQIKELRKPSKHLFIWGGNILLLFIWVQVFEHYPVMMYVGGAIAVGLTQIAFRYIGKEE